jgi:hypothetical protein
VIHIDAKWDGGRNIVQRQLLLIEPEMATTVCFGYVDIDLEQDLPRDLKLTNVPSLAYYKGDILIALVIGARQDARDNIRRLISGEAIDQSNIFSNGPRTRGKV